MTTSNSDNVTNASSGSKSNATNATPNAGTVAQVEATRAAANVEPRGMEKLLPKKSLMHLINIAIGFLGIQFAWSVQMGQMGLLLEKLGSAPWLTSVLFCAGPVTGILVQPIVGSLSDRTWTVIGRRRPYFLVGAILSAICLALMPNVPAFAPYVKSYLAMIPGLEAVSVVTVGLALAATLLWILDASLNTSQGPYRALVPDTVPKEQQAQAFTLMSLTIGLGSVIAFFVGSKVPMEPLFYMGAVAMVAALLWTAITTPEVRYATGEHLSDHNKTLKGVGLDTFFKDTFSSIITMPKEALKLCLAHSFTWFGLFCFFMFFSLFVAHHIFHATAGTAAFDKAGQEASFAFLLFNLSCFLVSPVIGYLCKKVSKKTLHTIGLSCLGGGMLLMVVGGTMESIWVGMTLMGIGWATTLSLPFALLSNHIPGGNEGVLIGAFNIFIAAPQFIAAGTLSALMIATHDNYVIPMIIGTGAIFSSALLLQWVRE